MELIPKSLKIPKLYEQDGKGDETIVYVHIFNPCGQQSWFVTEFDPINQECFGYISLDNSHCNEWGYFTINELLSLKSILGIGVERDRYFEPCTILEACRKRDIYFVEDEKKKKILEIDKEVLGSDNGQDQK